MLYSLQILNTLMNVNASTLSEKQIEERHEWR